ncbi:hypothetical protein GC177_06600 [bacterium]|nr:hypothetical protein [bacterium]
MAISDTHLDLDFENPGIRQMAGRVVDTVTRNLCAAADELNGAGISTGYWQYRDGSRIIRTPNPNESTTRALLEAWERGLIHDLTFGIPMHDVLQIQHVGQGNEAIGRAGDTLLAGSMTGFLKISDTHEITLDGDVLRYFQSVQAADKAAKKAERIAELQLPEGAMQQSMTLDTVELRRSQAVYNNMRAIYGDIATRMDTISAHTEGVLRHCMRDVENPWFDLRWKPLKIWLEEHTAQHQAYGRAMLDNPLMHEALVREYFIPIKRVDYDEHYEPVDVTDWVYDAEGFNDNMLAFPIPSSVVNQMGYQAIARDIALLFGQGNYGQDSKLNLEQSIEFLMPTADGVGFVMIPGRLLSLGLPLYHYIMRASELIGLGEQASGALAQVLEQRLVPDFPEVNVTAHWARDYNPLGEIQPSLDAPENHWVQLTVETHERNRLNGLLNEIISVFPNAQAAAHEEGLLMMDIPLTDVCALTHHGGRTVNDAAIAALGQFANGETINLS